MVFALHESSSSSYSSTPRSWTYHVFLSFRGEDTRKGFTDHLYASLERKGIKTFKDDKDLQRGEVISEELLNAIEESMFAIVVLSPNYASSTWCLDELQKIVEWKEKQAIQVMPLFYGVDPSDVRHQRKNFEEAFKIHEEKLGQDSEKVQKWRDALRQVAGYSGWDSNNLHEAELVESIAQHIHKMLIPKLPSCTENFVGIASKVKEVNELIGIRLNDVRFIGIWGMGGIGKTTIARTVYEAIQDNFTFTCFLANVRQVSETNGLVQLQRDLLSCLNINSGGIHNLYDGEKTIKNSLSNQKVLLVLDDVSDQSQLENLAAKLDWFGPGSRVIITTRDKHLLRIHGVHDTYEVEGLVQNDALHLFCLKAFKQAQPKHGYLDLSKEVVKYTGGLPLALEVLGSYLYGRAIDVWYSALKQIRSFPHPKIQDALKISYENLNPMEKNLFLDIACFFKGMNINKVIDILKCCGHCPIIGIEVLIERSLITLEQQNNNLEMHDLLQDMGRNIVFQESPDDPGKRSRLWSQGDIDYVFIENKGTEAIQGTVLNLLQRYEERWNTNAFSNTSQLKFLILNGMKLNSGLDCLPRSLKVLHWRGCSLKSLPLTNQPYDFVDIKLSLSKLEELWNGEKFVGNLKYLDLSFSMNLKQLPDFSGVPNLETLTIEGCTSLTTVHPSLVHHKRLVLLNLKDCTSLKALPSKLEMNSLKELILTGCSKFQNLPEFGKSMKSLTLLSLQGSAVQKLPTSLGCLAGLELLNLEDCKLLVSLPKTICRLHSLKELLLSGCFKFQNLPEFGENMKHLSKVSLDETAIREVPSSLGCLVGVVNLSLTNCKNLICLPDIFDRLKSLTHLSTYGCSELGKLSSAMNEGPRIGLPHSILSLPSLVVLNLRNCSLSEESIRHDFCDLPSLQKLDLSHNNFTVVPINISKLPKLQYLGLCFCPKLQRLPELPPSIIRLNASNCYSLEISEFNPCNLFTSLGPHPPKVGSFDMLITGEKIPSWFVHREDGEYVSVPFNCPLNDSVGIAVCFLLISYARPSENFLYTVECCLDSRLGKHIMERQLSWIKPGCPHLYVLLLTGHEFNDQIRQDSRFGLYQKAKVFSQFDGQCRDPNLLDLKIVCCGSRLLYMQDIEVLNHSIEDFKALEQHALGGGVGSHLSIPLSLKDTVTATGTTAKKWSHQMNKFLVVGATIVILVLCQAEDHSFFLYILVNLLIITLAASNMDLKRDSQ